MNRREYAASLGLAKPNTRGRLSREAHIAIAAAEKEGRVFSDTPNQTATPSPKVSSDATIVEGTLVEPAKPKPPQQKRRDINVYTLTTTNGQIIRFGHCAACKQAIMYCRCQPEPRYPEWIKDEVETWLPGDLVVG